jgi:hypothetical protein
MTYLEYLACIKRGNPAPKLEDAECWKQLDSKAQKIQSELTDEEQERKWKERRERTDKLIAELEARRLCKSNGTPFNKWECDFREHVSLLSGLCGAEIPMTVVLAAYDRNESSNIAALDYVNEYDPPQPDPELEKQRTQINRTLAYLSCVDHLHKRRVGKALSEEYGLVNCEKVAA